MVATDGHRLAKINYIPNPVDESFEKLNVYSHNNLINDVFFALSHGVHRGVLKKGKFDVRENFINKLITKTPNIKFDVYGINNIQPIWADSFYKTIEKSKMGLNLSRTNSVKYYTSNRVYSLIGNVLKTFIDIKTQLNDFFSDDEVIFYKNVKDLSEKLNYFKENNQLRKKIAENGQKKYFKFFNSKLIAKYIIHKTFDAKSKDKFYWEKN